MADDKKTESAFAFSAKKIPTDAGCYLFFDVAGTILYVGKAKNLRNRVRSYFQKTEKSPKTESLVKKISRIETRVVESETEALILENNLIKKWQPRYNILLRDDKNFLYLRITNELFPRLEITRRIVRDGSFYLGPKTSAKKFRATIAFCQKIFQIRTCRLEFSKCGTVAKNPEKRSLPCLDFHIKKCSGPCAAKISTENYRADVERMKKFLRGDTREVLVSLREKMMKLAAEKNFETAARTRDLIQSIESSTQSQSVQFSDLVARDFVHFFRDGKSAFFVRLVFRNGKFLDQNEVEFHAEKFESDSELIEKFLLQFYERVDEMPSEIFLPERPENAEELAEILHVKLQIPERGEKKKVLQLARKNAEKFFKTRELEIESRAENFANALPELAEILKLPALPRRIEGYDISHFAGKETVASQIVFVDGEPKKSEYRRFKIRSLAPGEIDDFKSMNEVLARRFSVFAKNLQNKKLDNFADFLQKNKKLLQQFLQFQKIMSGVDFWLLGGLAAAFSVGRFWRQHEDFDVLVEKKNWKKTQKLLIAAGFEKTENTENFFTFSKKGFPPIDVSPLGVTLPIGKFSKKNTDSGLKKIGETSARVLNFQTLLEIKRTLAASRENEKDGRDLKIMTEFQTGEKLPDLIVIDGGKGQLSAVLKVFANISHPGFDPKKQIVALAKQEEEVFVPGQSDPIDLPADSAASKLLQRCRDEAHRFAISFNRSLREKTAIRSALDEISGIGPTTKKKLLKTFGSVSGIRAAEDEQLRTIISAKSLQNLRKNL
ncbi:excinuclease ABC subunit UvrC [bacterium]|nr:excinuclease ABC subunit UvrC [bacterium]MBT6831725.1 excinuclease ABC subunit UvrC [bacterium]MBT6996548.1 excinuclease ABC subunit UvrC [bacterium]MBT7772874.1 excinuclease ABC subunit UvrC [bacterium]